MFNKPRVQSLINLNLTKLFAFREHVTEKGEVDQLIDLIFKSMATQAHKQHKLTLDEYLEVVREALQLHLPNSRPITHEFWVAQAKSGWALAFPDDFEEF